MNFDKDSQIIDKYNKFRVLISIFNSLIFKIKSSQCDNEELVNYYDNTITDYLIKNKICQDENKDFTLLFTDKNDLLGIKNTNNEKYQIILLSMFEEELRCYLKQKKKIMNRSGLIINSSLNVHTNLTILKNDDLATDRNNEENIFKELFKVLYENFEFINHLFEIFKISDVEREKREIHELEVDFNKIRTIMKQVIKKITDKLTCEQNFKLLDYVKKNVIDEKLKLNKEIEVLKSKLKDYTEKGEELSILVKEYKKLCNLLECKKMLI